MKNLLAFVDFTDMSPKVVDQAIALAKMGDAAITICHIAEHASDAGEIIIGKLDALAARAQASGVKAAVHIGKGQFHHEAVEIAKRLRPDMAVVGTHGVAGIRLSFLGSSIHKLVKELPIPTLVVNELSKIVEGGFNKVMMPVAPHKEYMNKVKQTCAIMSPDGIVVIYAIIKPGLPLSNDVIKNIEAAKQYLDEHKVKWEYTEVDADRYSIGYAKQTLAETQTGNMDLISIMSRVSQENSLFGKMDKESMLLNELGIPVLCASGEG